MLFFNKNLEFTRLISRFFIFLWLMQLFFFVPEAYAGWVSPTGLGATNGWTNGNNARDNNTGTYASRTAEAAWGQYLEFTYGPAIYCDRIRVYSDFGYGQVDSVQVQANNGGWTDVFKGVVSDGAWSELPFTALTNVTGGRFRFHWRPGASYTFWLYEFQFWSGVPPVAPTVQTDTATSVNLTSAVPHGRVIADGGSIGQYRFKYGLTTSYTDSTPWSGNVLTGSTFGASITGLTAGTTYHYRAQVKNSAGTGNGLDRTFSTGAPSAGWISPTGYSDAAARWSAESLAFDDETATYAQYVHQIGETNWSQFLTLTFPATFSSDSVRFYASSNAQVDSIDIDTYDGTTWSNGIATNFTNQTWTRRFFSIRNVTQARVRFRTPFTNQGFPMELFELDCWKRNANAPALAYTGEANYAADGLDPETGYSDTDFEYRILYTDADNDGPAIIEVRIDRDGDGNYTDPDERVALSVASDAAAVYRDGNYANGEIFSVTTNISYIAATNYRYRFYASDGSLTVQTANVANKPVVSPYPSAVTPDWSKASLGTISGAAASDTFIYVGRGSAQNISKYRLRDGVEIWTGGYSTAAWGACGMPTYIYSNSISKYRVLFKAGNYVVGFQDDGASRTQLFAQNITTPPVGNPYPSPDDSSFYVTTLNTISKRKISDGTVRFNTAAAYVSTSADPVVFGDMVYAASTDGRVYSADAADGTPLNTYSGLGGAAVNQPLLVWSDTLYVSPDDNKIYIMRASTLALLATITTASQNSGPAFRDETGLYAAAGNYVQRFPVNGGAAVWTKDLGDLVQSGPIIYNNSVFVGRDGGRYYALDPANGNTKSDWPYVSASGDAATGPWIDVTFNRALFATTGGNLDAFDLP